MYLCFADIYCGDSVEAYSVVVHQKTGKYVKHQRVTCRTLLFGGARMVQMQSTAWSGFTLYSSSTWLERIIPSAPVSSNWQSDPQTATEVDNKKTKRSKDIRDEGERKRCDFASQRRNN